MAFVTAGAEAFGFAYIVQKVSDVKQSDSRNKKIHRSSVRGPAAVSDHLLAAAGARVHPQHQDTQMLRRTLHAANAVFSGYVIARVGSLVLVPLFLRYWSANLYGEYLALFAMVNYLNSLNIGVHSATVNRLTQAYVRHNFDEYRSIQHSALAFYVALAAMVTIVVATVSWFLPISHWIGLRLTKPSTTTLVIILLAAYVLWAMPMRLIVATYQTFGNLARSYWILNIQQIAMAGVSAVLLMLGGGMRSIALLQVLSVLIIASFVLVDLRRRFPVFIPGFSKASVSVLKEMSSPSILFALLLVGNLIAYEGSILVISAAMGGLAVAVFSVSKSIIDVIRQGLYGISLSLCPDLARMEALGEFEKLRKVHRLVVAATSAITLAFVGSVWYEGPQIISVWTRGRIEPDVILLRLLLVLVAFQTPWATSSTLATATNRHKAQAVGYFFAATLGIAVVATLIHRLGTWAAPIGLTIGEAICCYHFVIKATCQMIGESYAAFALRFWLGFIAVSAVVLVTGSLVHNQMPGPMLLRWIAMGISSLMVAAACGWLVWLSPEDRSLLLPKVRLAFAAQGAKAA